MKLPVIKLLGKGFSSLDLLDFILPLFNLAIGLGIVHHFAFKIHPGLFLQFIVLFIFLELGSQFLEYYKKNFPVSNRSKEVLDEKRASSLIVILFFSLSIIPLTQIILEGRQDPAFLLILAISGVEVIIWRDLGNSLFGRFFSIFLLSFNNAFLLPLTQLFFYGLVITPLFVTISQINFLFIFGILIFREVVGIELQDKESNMVRLIGTVPLVRISAILFLAGWVLMVIFVIQDPSIELITLAAVSAAVLILIGNFVLNLYRYGRPALNVLWNVSRLLLLMSYLGWGTFLFLN